MCFFVFKVNCVIYTNLQKNLFVRRFQVGGVCVSGSLGFTRGSHFIARTIWKTIKNTFLIS